MPALNVFAELKYGLLKNFRIGFVQLQKIKECCPGHNLAVFEPIP
jgi:hypothetical protein